MSDPQPAGAYDDHRVLDAIRDTLATGPLHEVHELPDGTAFVGTAEEAAIQAGHERTAALSDAFHDGYGTGIGDVEDEWTARVAAARAEGYAQAVARLRTFVEKYFHPAGEMANVLHQALRFVEAVKETTDGR